MALKTNAEKIRQGYINACNAVLGRGGSIASGAPIGDLAEAIINIPHDTTLAYHEVDSTAYRSIVPSNADNRALVNKIGGKSYKTRNLIPYPYAEKSKTVNGITFTDNGDGTVTVNGTATANATFYLYLGVKLDRLIAGETYTPSIGNSGIGSSVILMCNYTYTDGVEKNFTTSAIGARTYPSGAIKDNLYLLVQNGTTMNNVTIYPMINEGDTALLYEPYFDGLRDTKVTVLESEGANLIPFPYADGAGKTMNGITFAVNDDRSISVKGTATANATFYFVRNLRVSADNYYISGEGDIRGYKVDVNNNTIYFNKGAQIFDQLYYISMYVVVLEGDTVDYTVYPMMNRGTTASPYKPYVGTLDTLAIPEAVQSLDGYGQGKSDTEYNFIDLINKTFPKEYGKVRLPSTAGGYNAENNWYYIGVGIGISPISRDVLCNLLPSVDIATYTEAEGIYMNSSLSHIILRKRGFTTQEEYRQWLADNEVYIIERLAEPVLTDISEYLTDEFIKVEGGGTITAVNEHEEGVPTSVTYLIETVGG